MSLLREIKKLTIPRAVILGNHDRGFDRTGNLLRAQLDFLGEEHCGWTLRDWQYPDIAVVGARPCSSGGGFFVSQEVQAVFGPITMEESINRIVFAAENVPSTIPLVILAHSGPTGLGSDAHSICGRDWKSPSIDWGDKDLEIAIDVIRKRRVPELVVFGHMHHFLKRTKSLRTTFFQDRWGTAYLNAACVPRRGQDTNGDYLCHFSWVEFVDSKLQHISHRWFRDDCSIAFQETLLNEAN